MVGKTTTTITHPARHIITVVYEGVEYDIDDKKTYNRYKDKMGQNTTGTLRIRTYDDDSVRYDIVDLELEEDNADITN